MDTKDFSQREDIQSIIKLRRARQMALAIIKRGRDAGIPEKYMRINQKTFSDVLDPDFHGGSVRGIPAFADSIYHDPDFLMKRDFISIDGGDTNTRNIAGFAILFRMIAYDKRGKYCSCVSLKHKFQTINSTEDINRNDLAEELKVYDILMLSEFDKSGFNPHFETGSFFDEVLGERSTRGYPTIITFVSPIISKKLSQEEMARDGQMDSGCGRQFAMLNLTSQTTKNVLRVRVKS
jgi:hypothetical protein